ncbi:ComEA family DNA-binding protein [Anditalea andensis]|uniref:Competence protein ComEA n=1 Tax=Anditalea andensis TaxID=1048983 RepID=A0A074L4Q5_9BACT|nr:helix-hairpin-helix domain-containing protein [Anditalea andensis]KEO74843.1 hypothetical protein EL17_03965 [Anditalea andensis]
MKRKVFYFLKIYMGFTKRESKGFILVMPTLIILYFIPIIFQRCINNHHKQEYDQYIMEAERFFALQREAVDSTVILAPDQIPLFDPNKVDKDFLVKMGIKDPVAANWENYLKRGGLFREWEDVRKIYGLEEGFLLSIKDRMVFDTLPDKKAYKRPSSPTLAKIPFSEADSIVLQIVPGIGGVMAGRIIKFRDNVGGLHQKSQLLDVYGVEEELVEKIFDHFTFEPGISRKININTSVLTDLSQHPYISYAQAKVIVAYRDQHGPFLNSDDLLKIKIFTPEWVNNIAPYLSF